MKKGKKRIRVKKTVKRRVKRKKQIAQSSFAAIKTSIVKIAVILLIVGLNWIGLSTVIGTSAYFNDIETSSGNAHVAGSLDFALSSYKYERSIGLDETVSKSSVLVNSGGMDFQYTLEAEEVSDDDGFCDILNLQAKLNGIEKYDGNLMSLITSTSTTLGTWKFNIELPVDEDSFTNGEKCQFDIVFKGWQTNIASYGDGGFSDEERINFTLTAGKMVVLNEFLPRPDGVAYGFDFGNDSSNMPQGEWIELYNNSTQAVDLSGWYTRDATNGDGNKVFITVLNTSPATTTIGGKGWLVVYMNKPILNNTGDTVRLFDASNNLIDSHSYDDPDFCEIEPTPGNENSTDASGSCGSVPHNKSYARIPDGIGEWVDPVPTPGKANVIENPSIFPSFSETLELMKSAIIEFVLDEEEMMASTSPEIIASSSIEIIEPSPESLMVETATTTETIVPDATEQTPSEEIVIITEEQPAIEEQPVVVEEPIIIEQPVPSQADSTSLLPAE